MVAHSRDEAHRSIQEGGQMPAVDQPARSAQDQSAEARASRFAQLSMGTVAIVLSLRHWQSVAYLPFMLMGFVGISLAFYRPRLGALIVLASLFCAALYFSALRFSSSSVSGWEPYVSYGVAIVEQAFVQLAWRHPSRERLWWTLLLGGTAIISLARGLAK